MTTHLRYYRFRPNIIAAMRPPVKEHLREVAFEYERLVAARVDNSTSSDP